MQHPLFHQTLQQKNQDVFSNTKLNINHFLISAYLLYFYF